MKFWFTSVYVSENIYLFIQKEEFQRGRGRGRQEGRAGGIFHPLFQSPIALWPYSGPGWSLCHTCGCRAQLFEPSSAVFQITLAGSLSRSKIAGKRASSDIGCQRCRQWFYPLCYSPGLCGWRTYFYNFWFCVPWSKIWPVLMSFTWTWKECIFCF